MAIRPARRVIEASKSADKASCSAPSPLDTIAAACSPPARVDRASGTELPPPLLRAVVDLTYRNMRGYAGGAWSSAEKRDELSHADTRHIAISSGRQLLGFAAWRLTYEEGVLVGYLYELQLEEAARGMRLGSGLLAEVDAAARAAGAHGLMLTVHSDNKAAGRFYANVGFEVSPMSPAMCAPPIMAQACKYEIMQKIWDADSHRELLRKGGDARRENWIDAIDSGSLKVRCVMKKHRRSVSA